MLKTGGVVVVSSGMFCGIMLNSAFYRSKWAQTVFLTVL